MAQLTLTGANANTLTGVNVQGNTTATTGDDTISTTAAYLAGSTINAGNGFGDKLVLTGGGTFDLSAAAVLAGIDQTFLDSPGVIIGTGIGDYFSGSAGDDTLSGGGGDDGILGMDGHDVLWGNAGPDTLEGGDGNDTLSGGADEDELRGGNGDDVIVISGSSEFSQYEYVIDGGAGTDTIRVLSPSGAYDFSNAEGIERIEYGNADAGADWAVTGTGGNDVIAGSGGNETMAGGNGNDTLSGLGGDDSLYGGVGEDVLHGGAGKDTLLGGDGNDVIVIDTNTDFTSDESINGGNGYDVIRLMAPSGTINLNNVANVERIEYGGSSDADWGVTAGIGHDLIVGGGGRETMMGGIGNDTLSGAGGHDVLTGDGGEDSLLGGAGNDTLDGGDGNDTLSGGDGNDVYLFDASNTGSALVADLALGDVIRVNNADFSSGTITDGDGGEVAAHSVQVFQSGGVTRLFIDTDGALGPDVTVRLAGAFSAADFALSGGDIALRAPLFTTGTDTYTDTGGNALTASATTSTINTGDNVDAGDGTDTLNATLANGQTTGAATLAGWENLNLTVASGNTATFNAQNVSSSTLKPVGAGTHVITNASVNVDASGLTGAGTLDATFTGGNVAATGGGSDDVFAFGTSLNANDTISGGNGNDTLTATLSNLSGSAGTLRLADVEVLDLTSSGSANQISLASATGLNTVKVAGSALLYLSGVGGSVTTIDSGTATGAQSITLSGAANVRLKGGAGNDTFDLGTTLTSADTISGGAGDDTVSAFVTGLSESSGSLQLNGVETLELTGYDAASTIMLTNANGLTTLNLAGSSNLAVSDIISTVTRIDGSNAMGALNLNLGEAADVLVMGGAGNDIFKFYGTLTNADTISGGAGNDTVNASASGLNATTGAFTLSGVEALWLNGESGPSVVDLSNATGLTDVRIRGGMQATVGGFAASVARIDGSDARGALTINYAQTANVTISGGEGSDAITGGAGADVIGGFIGNDTLYGGGGADTLSGGAGNDVLYGGAGSDVFGYAAADGTAVDSIGDFAIGDVIRVNGATLSGGIGTTLAAHGVKVSTVSNVTRLDIDLDGNSAAAELTINLAGVFSTSNLRISGNEISAFTPAPPSTGGDGGGGGSGTPNTTTQTVDGVTVQQTTQTASDGTRTDMLVVPVVTAGRTEQNAATPNADIPLARDTAGQAVLEAHVPVGVGLTVESTTSTAQGVQGLIRAIQNRTQNQPGDQSAMTGIGQSFLDVLPPTTNLTVRTIVPTVANPAAPPAQPIVISGTPSAGGTGAQQQAVVIDASSLPSGTVIQLQNVEFAAVVGAVRVTGGEGSQVVAGDSADQWMVLGADDDTLRGGGGNDFVGSEGGDDVLYGDTGLDTVTGGIGNDVLYGNQQDDVVYGNQGLDTLFGGQDADTLFGGQDGDVLYGNRASDVLYGQLGSDTLFGGQDNDVLFGGQGNDVLAGNLGADTLTGGLGADIFRIGAPQEGGDVIADFTLGEDRIAVAGPNFGSIPAGALSAGHFALDNPTTAGAQFVFNTRSGVLSFDADGSGVGAAVAIATLNVRTLSHTDILVLGN
ncbi:hypothetical protein [Azospirillum sp.]|uniref:beta strand repeat-containing protein n=1 Tax=Azospirillum sp. TaxID=34012 RepID=UPI002D42DB0D|nr:hypothetical protein [Azospirillum sp.]HYD70904.1 hypothetical protein [Azospirillum sp.]